MPKYLICEKVPAIMDKPKIGKSSGDKTRYEPISITVDEELLEKIKERASGLGLNVSQYLRALAAQDVSTRGDLVLRETPPPYGSDKKKPDAGKK